MYFHSLKTWTTPTSRIWKSLVKIWSRSRRKLLNWMNHSQTQLFSHQVCRSQVRVWKSLSSFHRRILLQQTLHLRHLLKLTALNHAQPAFREAINTVSWKCHRTRLSKELRRMSRCLLAMESAASLKITLPKDATRTCSVISWRMS